MALTPEELEQEIEQLYGELTFAAVLLSRMLSVLGKDRANDLISETARSIRLEDSQQVIGAKRFKGRLLHNLSNQRPD